MKVPYTLDISAGVVAATDYTVCLRKGDVMGAAVDGVPDKVAIYRPGGTEAEGSTGNVAHNHPAKSPLPSGKLSADDIADRTGVYRIRVSGDVTGSYTLTVVTTRPNLERTGRVQTIVLDFDGARLDPSTVSIDVLTYLSTDSLVHPGHRRGDRAQRRLRPEPGLAAERTGWGYSRPHATGAGCLGGTGIPPHLREPVFTDEEFTHHRDSAFDRARTAPRGATGGRAQPEA